jgi:hypothetical protein
MNKETVFTNNERGKLLQKAWINEFIEEIADEIDKLENKIDFILVTPDGKNDAKVGFFNLKEFQLSKAVKKSDKRPIVNWVNSHSYVGSLSVIFINKKGRISFYNVPLGLMRKINFQTLIA